MSGIKRTAIGAAIMIGLYCVCSLIMTFVAFSAENSTANTGLYSLFSLLVAGGAGTLLSAKLMHFSGAISAMAPASAVLVIYTVVALILTGGRVNATHAMNMICFLMISALFAYLSRPRAKNRRMKVRR